MNSSEHRAQIVKVLKLELGTSYVGLPVIETFFFECVTGLKPASETIFEKFTSGDKPFFRNRDDPLLKVKRGWSGWPEDAKEVLVLDWFEDFVKNLEVFAKEYEPGRTYQRRLLRQPESYMPGSKALRKLDIGFADHPEPKKGSKSCHWSQVLVPGELKSNPYEDNKAGTNSDLAVYAREVFTAQGRRRFVLGFTLCGSLMRIWEFDRLGAIASEAFDINEDGERFVSVILGFLWMNDQELGFDPTITKDGDQWWITINREGQTERLVIGEVPVRPAHCIAGRATVCWKAHRKGEPDRPLVIKDSWQYVERPEEGELLRKATDGKLANVVRYYHHETVMIDGKADEIQGNVRGGLDVTKATNYRPQRSASSSGTNAVETPSEGQSSSNVGTKRTASHPDETLPPSKRSCSTSSTKVGSNELPNRVHRRVILEDYGKAIYGASSRSALLAALEGCINGHEALHKNGILHRDISINNLMINGDPNNLNSWPSFLIDLDLAIEEGRENASGANGRTGTRAFMAIGVLRGRPHSFMHDLESFFWVLFWVCIHYTAPNKSRVMSSFQHWNYATTDILAREKAGVVSSEISFLEDAVKYFSDYYKPLVPWVEKLRGVVFPGGQEWVEDEGLYTRMKLILREARGDPGVLGAAGGNTACQ